MKNHSFLSFIKKTMIGGVFFLIPIMLLYLAFEKIIDIIRTFVSPIIGKIANETLGGIRLSRLIAFSLLLLLCFLMGLLANTNLGHRVIGWVDNNILSLVPGYTFLKRTGETMAGLESDNLQKVVLVDLEETLQIGFLTDQIDDDLSVVYIPGAPNPMAGDVVFVKSARIKVLDIPPLTVMRISSKLGVGSKKSLKGKIRKV